EVQQLVGGVAHRADGDHDVVTAAACVDDTLRDALDALRVRDRRTAVLLHDERHSETPEWVDRNARMPHPCVNPTDAAMPLQPCDGGCGRAPDGASVRR